MPEMSFQAVIWFDVQAGRFQVQIRPYDGHGAMTYVAMMDAEKVAEFIVLTGVDPDLLDAVSPPDALVVEGVEVEDASDLAKFGFKRQTNAVQ